jgi:hypothetical protein
MHVSDLDNTLTVNGSKKWQATVRVSIRDAAKHPLIGASMNGSWSIGANSNCHTGSGGDRSFPTKAFRTTTRP